MKKTILAAAIAALATPALAQGIDVGAGEYNETARTQANLTPWRSPMMGSYAYAPGQTFGQYGYGVAPGSVYENGEKIGQDPDPSVRLQLRRDALLGDPAIVSVPQGSFGYPMM